MSPPPATECWGRVPYCPHRTRDLRNHIHMSRAAHLGLSRGLYKTQKWELQIADVQTKTEKRGKIIRWCSDINPTCGFSVALEKGKESHWGQYAKTKMKLGSACLTLHNISSFHKKLSSRLNYFLILRRNMFQNCECCFCRTFNINFNV